MYLNGSVGQLRLNLNEWWWMQWCFISDCSILIFSHLCLFLHLHLPFVFILCIASRFRFHSTKLTSKPHKDISQQSVTRIINLSASVLVFHFPIVVAVACLQTATLDTIIKIMLRASCIVWLVNGTMVRYFLLSPPALQHHYASLTPTHASFTVCACVSRYLSKQ